MPYLLFFLTKWCCLRWSMTLCVYENLSFVTIFIIFRFCVLLTQLFYLDVFTNSHFLHLFIWKYTSTHTLTHIPAKVTHKLSLYFHSHYTRTDTHLSFICSNASLSPPLSLIFLLFYLKASSWFVQCILANKTLCVLLFESTVCCC